MKHLRNIKGILLNPVRTIRKLLLGTPIVFSLIVLAGFLLSMVLTQWITRFPLAPGEAAFIMKTFAPQCVLLLVVLFLGTALIHLTADLLNGAGRGLNLFLLSLISLLPFWFAAPLALLFDWLIPAGVFLTGFLLSLGLWSLSLFLIAIREIYRFNIRKAFLTLFIPAAIITGLCMIILFSGSNRMLDNLKDTSRSIYRDLVLETDSAK
ncbi:YIP1 family protein [bacterium]|nr:YIP1 family protein [candidate division CSSED10-310 bacterium]